MDHKGFRMKRPALLSTVCALVFTATGVTAQNANRDVIEIDASNTLGQGYHTSRRVTTLSCIEFIESSNESGFGDTVGELEVYTTKSEIARALGAGVSLNVASGAAAAGATFAQNSTVSEFSLAFGARGSANVKTQNIFRASLLPEFADLAATNPVEFFNRCGTHFMSSIWHNATYLGLVTTSSQSASSSRFLSTRFSTQWPFNISGSISDEERRELSRSSGIYSQTTRGAAPFSTPTPSGTLEEQLEAVLARFDEFDDLAAQSGGSPSFATLHQYNTLVNWPVNGGALPPRRAVFDDLSELYWRVDGLSEAIAFIEANPGQFHFTRLEQIDQLNEDKEIVLNMRDDIADRLAACSEPRISARCSLPNAGFPNVINLQRIENELPQRFEGNCNLQPERNATRTAPSIYYEPYTLSLALDPSKMFVKRLPKISGGGRDVDDPLVTITTTTNHDGARTTALKLNLKVVIGETNDDRTTYGATRSIDIFNVKDEAPGCRIVGVANFGSSSARAPDDEHSPIVLYFNTGPVERSLCLTDTRGRSDEFDLYCEDIKHRDLLLQLENIELDFDRPNNAITLTGTNSFVAAPSATDNTSNQAGSGSIGPISMSDLINRQADALFSNEARSLLEFSDNPLREVSAGSTQVVGEKCAPFDVSRLAVTATSGQWQIKDGQRTIFAFGTGATAENEAREALSAIQTFQFTQFCYVNAPNSEMQYLKAGASVPSGPTGSFDCIPFNNGSVSVTADGDRWLLSSSNSRMLIFNEEDEARQSADVIRAYRLNRQCFVGRPNASFFFWLSN